LTYCKGSALKTAQSKKHSSKLYILYNHFSITGVAPLILQSSALKKAQPKKHSSKLGVFLTVLFIRDPNL